MNLKNILEGIGILKKYYKDPDIFHMGAEHDVIVMYPTDSILSEDDIKKMIELGWMQELVEGLFCTHEDYDHQETWLAYL